MRLAPVPMFFAANPADAVHYGGESSRTTHGARECIDACRYYSGLIVGALRGLDKVQLLDKIYEPVPGIWDHSPLAPKIAEVAAGSFRSALNIRGTGYVVQSLEAALWAFYSTTTFRAGALAAVNLGEDADTTGAVYGQLAGAYYGADAIPAEWRAKIALRDRIEDWADRLRPE